MLNVRYISGFTGSFAVLLLTADQSLLLTDSRYQVQAAEESPHFKIVLVDSDWIKTAEEYIHILRLSRIGFESESTYHNTWSKLLEALGDTELAPTSGLVEKLRMVKDPGEQAALREAIRITDEACSHIVGILKPGMTEIDVAFEIDCFMKKHDAEKEAFDTIVASGPRSAMPHAKPTKRQIQEGEFIVLDFGAQWHGYTGDITRTILLGTPDEKHQEIFRIVHEAQTQAIAAIRPGARGGDIDAIARKYIADQGYGEYFGHGLGHGLGLEVHDGKTLSKNSDIILQAGMVTTVEPGIYLPGWGGVRIEDDVLVTKNGHEILTHSPLFAPDSSD